MSAIMRLRQARNAEQLANEIEPLAQSLATLSDEARQTLEEINKTTQEHGERFSNQIETALQSWVDAASKAQKAADSLSRAGARMEWIHYFLCVAIGIISAMLVTGLFLWQVLPNVQVQNTMDTKAVAELLKPAILESVKHTKTR